MSLDKVVKGKEELRDSDLGNECGNWCQDCWIMVEGRYVQDQTEVTDMDLLSRDSARSPGYYSSCPTIWTIWSSRFKGAWMTVADGDAICNPWQAPTSDQQWRPLGIWNKACPQLQTTPPLLRSSNILLLCFSGEACLIQVLCFPMM